MKPKINNSATISKKSFCKNCGWPVVEACCTDGMLWKHPTSDWWLYCSNQGCKKHNGEELNINGEELEWTFRI